MQKEIASYPNTAESEKKLSRCGMYAGRIIIKVIKSYNMLDEKTTSVNYDARSEWTHQFLWGKELDLD